MVFFNLYQVLLVHFKNLPRVAHNGTAGIGVMVNPGPEGLPYRTLAASTIQVFNRGIGGKACLILRGDERRRGGKGPKRALYKEDFRAEGVIFRKKK